MCALLLVLSAPINLKPWFPTQVEHLLGHTRPSVTLQAPVSTTSARMSSQGATSPHYITTFLFSISSVPRSAFQNIKRSFLCCGHLIFRSNLRLVTPQWPTEIQNTKQWCQLVAQGLPEIIHKVNRGTTELFLEKVLFFGTDHIGRPRHLVMRFFLRQRIRIQTGWASTSAQMT